MSVDVVFFDVTTFYFESQHTDTLREFGFSKDGKLNEVQVVLTLLIDKDGRPISFEVFPGNTFEGHTLLSTLARVKQRFQIDQVIIVADKGLNSKLNLKTIKDRGYDYIVSCRVKNLPQKMKDQVVSACHYQSIPLRELFGGEDDEQKPHTFKYKVLDYTNVVKYKDEKQNKTIKLELSEKLICSWSSRRAAKDKADRQRQVEKAQKAITENHKSILSHRGYKRYIKKGHSATTDETLSLDQEKIEAEARFDGYGAIQCSRLDCGAVQVMRAYRQLLKIEESFRVIKSTLRTRPVFVWTPEHVKGHFVMCFLAFALERNLEYRLNTRGIDNSPEQIKSALRSMQCSELDIEDEPHYLRGKHQPLASQIFAVLKVKQPNNIMKKQQWEDYLKQE
jgi:transposase